MAVTKKEETVYFVYDTTATAGRRVHEMISDTDKNNIRSFTFPNDTTPVQVPAEFIYNFIKLQEAFEVYPTKERNMAQRLRPMANNKKTDKPIIMAADEVVANIRELSHEALVQRAIDLGAVVDINTDKAVLQKILLTKDVSEHKKAPQKRVDEMTEEDLAELTTDQLNALLDEQMDLEDEEDDLGGDLEDQD